MSNKYAVKIEKLLNPLQWLGVGPSQLYRDWLSCVEITLNQMPEYIRSGGIIPNAPNAHEAWQKIESQYSSDVWEKIKEAFADALVCLFQSTMEDYRDTVGDVYMRFGNPNPSQGQYFTPRPICRFMAQSEVPDGGELLMNRIQDAIKSGDSATHIHAQMMVMASSLIPNPFEHLITKVVPAALSCGLKPITVMDCCVGSGALLLAMASRFPSWANMMGLIQYYGSDIDPTCVKMARINCMLYGLNGYGMKIASSINDRNINQQITLSANPFDEGKQSRIILK